MIAVDANILVYAHRRDSAFHAPAKAVISALAAGRASWGIPWQCLREFYAVATHPRLYKPSSTPAEAATQIDLWLESPSVVLLHEGPTHWARLGSLLRHARILGGLTHDAGIAAICLDNGVSELWTADRDFSRFAGSGLAFRNPLAG